MILNRTVLKYFKILLTIFLIIPIAVIWISYYELKTDSKQFQKNDSQNIANMIKMLKEMNGNLIDSNENKINENLKEKLKVISKEIEDSDKINSQYLKEISNKHKVSSIWLMKYNEKWRIIVYVSSEDKIMDATDWYATTELKEKWKQSSKEMLEKSGIYWINPKISYREYSPYNPYVWAYMGIKNKRGENNILEIGVDIEKLEIEEIKEITKKFKNGSQINENIVSIEDIYPSPEQYDKNISKEDQIYHNSGEITTTVNIETLKNRKSQVKIVTYYKKEVEKLKSAFWERFFITFYMVGVLFFIYITLHRSYCKK